LAALGFELRASHLLSSYCLSHSISLANFLPRLASNHNPPASTSRLLGLQSYVTTPDFFFFFWWDCSLNSGFHTCKASTLLLEPHLQSILCWLFWRWGLMNYCLEWPPTVILQIPASQVAGITGVSHWCLASLIILVLGESSCFP
jgi:hypothetical protein